MYITDYILLATGFLLIVVAILVYRDPNLMNPYGSMPPERKALVDIEGLKRASAIIVAVTGFILVVAGTLALVDIIDEMTSVYVMIVVSTAMLVPLMIVMFKYNGFGRKKRNDND